MEIISKITPLKREKLKDKIDPHLLIELRKHYSVSDIAKMFNVCVPIIYQSLKMIDHEEIEKHRKRKIDFESIKDYIIEDVNDGKSLMDISLKYQISYFSVVKYVRNTLNILPKYTKLNKK